MLQVQYCCERHQKEDWAKHKAGEQGNAVRGWLLKHHC
jgi:hypothetical protein